LQWFCARRAVVLQHNRAFSAVDLARAPHSAMHWPPRSPAQVLGYCLGMGVTYAALTQVRESLRDPKP